MSRYVAPPTSRDRAAAAIRQLRGTALVLWVLTVLFALGLVVAIGLGAAGTDIPGALIATLFGGTVSVAWFAAVAQGLAALVEVSLPPESASE